MDEQQYSAAVLGIHGKQKGFANGSRKMLDRNAFMFMSVLIAKVENSSQLTTSLFSVSRGLLLETIEVLVGGVQSTTTLIDHRTKTNGK